MTRKLHIENIIAKIVTQIAMSLPVSQIIAISFLKHGKLIASCNWNKIDVYQFIVSDKNQPAYIQTYSDIAELSEVIVSGIDADGKQFLLTKPYQAIIN